MDWTMIGAIGEALGAAGVILTLWYLARQVAHTRDDPSLSPGEHPWFVEQAKIIRSEMIGSPGFRSSMEARGHWLDPEFREILEGEMREGREYVALGIAER